MFIKVAVLKQERFSFSFRWVHFEILRLEIGYITDVGHLCIIVSL